MTTCEDCLAVRNLSLEPRVQGALCGACAEKLATRVRELEEALRPFAEMVLPLDAVQAAQYVWKRDIDRARRFLGLEVDRG